MGEGRSGLLPFVFALIHEESEPGPQFGYSLVILQKKVAGLTGSMAERFLLRARRAAGVRGLVNVLVTTSPAMRSLNRQFRGKDKPTDVLSFAADLALSRGRKPKGFAGDIAISADIAAANAARLGHRVADEVKILTLHGVLHLAGFDHERDNGEMARKEARLRKILALPSGLTERTGTGHRASRPNGDKARARAGRKA